MTPNTWCCNKHDQKTTKYSKNTTTQKQVLYFPDLYRFVRTNILALSNVGFFQVSTQQRPFTICASSAELRFNSLSKFLTPPLGSPSSPPVWLAVSTTVCPPGKWTNVPEDQKGHVCVGKVHGLQTPNSIQFFCDIFVSVFGMLVNPNEPFQKNKKKTQTSLKKKTAI